MKYYLLFLSTLFLFNLSTAQDILISQEGTVTVDCGDVGPTLTDAGGADNYTGGESYIITFCPGAGGNATSIILGGGNFDILPSDFLAIYDGDDTTATLLGNFNNNTLTAEIQYIASSIENTSGCLTFWFSSSEDSEGAGGFSSAVNCGTAWQPFDMEFSASPIEPDSLGYIDICQNTEVTINANGIFPFSDGSGYEQTNENCYFEWTLGDGTSAEGFGLTEIVHLYEGAFGFPIELFVTDTEGLRTRFELAVRVSTNPSFTGLLSQYRDTVCLGDSVTITGGLFGVNVQTGGGAVPTTGSFVAGGFLAGQTFLPDGTGASYETVIELDDFPDNATIENEGNIVSVCATMEHSYMGDMDITLTCPNGSAILLQGQGGGSCNLGEPWATGPVDNINSPNTPGVGYEYCWTPDATQSLEDGCIDNIEFIDGNGPGTYTDSQAQPGDYEPDQSFDGLVGCPVNGEWTITVTDYLSNDNGWIFSWGVTFSSDIQPEVETYQPELVTGSWQPESTIVEFSDTVIVVNPTEPGDYQYTFEVTDNFGCSYDTTVALFVNPYFSVDAISPGCYNTTELTVENSYQSGIWSFEGPSEDTPFPFFPATSGEVTIYEPGNYTMTFMDFFCDAEQSVDVFFPPIPSTEIIPDSTEICIGEGETLAVVDQPFNIPVSYQWQVDSAGVVTLLGSSQEEFAVIGGDYRVTVFSQVCPNDIAFGEAYVFEEPCVIETYNVFTPNGDRINDVFYIQAIDKFENPVVYVYNRWGKVVFEQKNYANTWDMDGLPDGTYYYVILNPANNETFKGSFTLTR